MQLGALRSLVVRCGIGVLALAVGIAVAGLAGAKRAASPPAASAAARAAVSQPSASAARQRGHAHHKHGKSGHHKHHGHHGKHGKCSSNGRRHHPKHTFKPTPPLCPASRTSVHITPRQGNAKGQQSVGPPLSATPSPGPPQGVDPSLDKAEPPPVGRYVASPPPTILPPPPTQAENPPDPATTSLARRTTSTATSAAATAHQAVVGDIQVIRNRDLAPQGAFASFTQPIAASLNRTDGSESSVAVSSDRQVVLWTSNKADGVSTDGGFSFRYLNPAAAFGGNSAPPGTGTFCCDQVVTFIPSVHRFVWILQYGENPNGAIRIATATEAQVAAGATNWTTYTFYPRDWGLSASAGQAINTDRPNIAFTRRNLYLTVDDRRDPGDNFQGTIFMRINYRLLGRGSIRYQWLKLPQGSGKVRLAPDASATDSVQYAAGAASNSRLNVYRWSDRNNSVYEYDMDIGTIATKDVTSADPTDPTGSFYNWLQRWGQQAGAVETGAKVGNSLLFGWEYGRTATVNRNGTDQDIHAHDQPGLGFVVINSDLNPPKKIAYQSIEFADYAATLPILRTDTNGDTALSFMWGGPTRHASHAVGFLINYAMATTISGQTDPHEIVYGGDYVGLTNIPGTQCFAASGSASVLNSSGDWYIDPHFIVFGRAEDRCTVPRAVFIPPPASKPDLVIDSIDANTNGTISINVRNAGTAAAAASKLSYNFGGGPSTVLDTPALDPGQAHTHLVACPSPGPVTVNALTDSTNLVAESDETNNARTATVNCPNTTPPPTTSTTTSTTTTTTPTAPDLIVASIHAPSDPNNPCGIAADIRNIGNAPAGPSQTRFQGTTFDQSVATPGIPAGQTVTVSIFRDFNQENSGTVTADATNAVAESNENNNTATGGGDGSANCHVR